MPRLFGRDWSREELLQKIGSIDQIGGARLIKLADGNEADGLAALCRTGSGLNFIVSINRGLDIVAADYNGASLCWRSHTGDVNSAYFEPLGFGWLRSFYGGLLCTCGATWCGAPCEDPDSIEGGPTYQLMCDEQGNYCLQFTPSGSLGLHGRFSHTPAKNVWVDGEWRGDDYVFWVQGKVREAQVFGPNLVVARRIEAKIGENKILVRDTVINEGFEPQDHMMLYHVNLGFPLVDEGAEYVFPSAEVIPRTDLAKEHIDTWSQFPAPIPHEDEWVYYHRLNAAGDGTVWVAFVNRNFGGGRGLGLYLRYNINALPWLVQWKMCAQGHYVTGLEPSTNQVDGRTIERGEGRLIVLQPGEKREYELEIGVLTNQQEIDEMVERIRSLGG